MIFPEGIKAIGMIIGIVLCAIVLRACGGL